MSTTATTTPKHVVVVGGGVQGSSVAYHLATASSTTNNTPPRVTLLESKHLASAASGKGGGFMARSWGDGGPTETLHHLAFDMYERLAKDLGCASYRKLPVMSVSPGRGGTGNDRPSWLDGNIGGASSMGYGAQITPDEFVHKLVQKAGSALEVTLGTCTGVEWNDEKRVCGVRYTPADAADDEVLLPCDAVVVSAGPWSCAAEDWFEGAVRLPMEGIKSTSVVFRNAFASATEGFPQPTALFCGEDDRFGTHLEVYPRPDGTVYLCGIGGSDYVPTDELKRGAYRDVCEANQSRVKAAVDSFTEMSATYRERGELDRVQACMRPCPPDALPYMGRIPGYEGAYINAGHNCWGIAWAPATGLAMSELVLTGKSTSVDLSPFDPARFTKPSRRGGRGRKQGNTSVGEQW